MHWNVFTIILLVGSLVVTGSFFVGGWFFGFKKRSHRFGLLMGIIMALAGVVSVFVNPVTNLALVNAIDDYRLSAIRQECIGKPVSLLEEPYGTPDVVWTNHYGHFINWHKTSPFFSMWELETIARVSNGVTVEIWTDN